MTHIGDASTHAIAEDHGAVVRGAWVGPAIGSAILTFAWALYLVPVFFGILATSR